MKRGFLLISTGTPYYGNLSLNCCLSIRANSNYETMLLCTASAIEGIEKQVEKYFTHVEIVPSEGAPMQQASKLKVSAYDYATKHFDECIMLDADSLVLPDKNLSPWFEQKQDFVAYYHAVYNFWKKKADRENVTFWVDPVIMQKTFGLESGYMPQINASWIYFRKSQHAFELFRLASGYMEIFKTQGDDYGLKLFRGHINEEPCFNVACLQLNQPLPQIPYRPLYLQVFSETIDETYIQHRFKAFSMAGDIIHDQRVVSLYNRLSDYYRGQYGIKEKCYFGATGKAGHNGTYNVDKTVFTPRVKDSYVASIYFTGSKNKWNNFADTPNIKLLENWAFSLKKTGLKGILFHNCFTKADIQTFSPYPVEFSYVEMPSGNNSGLFRFEVYADFLEKYHSLIEVIFFTDSTDLEVLKNPVTSMKLDVNKIYFGSEPWSFQEWVDKRNAMQIIRGYPPLLELMQDRKFAAQTVLNAGLVGGHISSIHPFIKKMGEECAQFAGVGTWEDMAIINFLAYLKFKSKIVTGAFVHTIFASYEKDNLVAWFKHK